MLLACERAKPFSLSSLSLSFSLIPLSFSHNPLDSVSRERGQQNSFRITAIHRKQMKSSSRNALRLSKKKSSIHRRASEPDGDVLLLNPILLPPPTRRPSSGSPGGPGSPPTLRGSPGNGARKDYPHPLYLPSSFDRRRCKSRGRSRAAAEGVRRTAEEEGR